MAARRFKHTTFEGVVNSTNATDPSIGYGFSDYGWNRKDWVALVFMTFGDAYSLTGHAMFYIADVVLVCRWLLLFSSIFNYWHVKRWEISTRASSQPAHPTTEEDMLSSQPTGVQQPLFPRYEVLVHIHLDGLYKYQLLNIVYL